MSNASHPARFSLVTAGLLGLSGVALGAFGAHGLKATLLERGMTQAWETAARYHLLHAVAVLALAAWCRGSATGSDANAPLQLWIARLWLAGVVLFSGSLYWLALGGPRWLGPVTPFGGIALMAGWLLVAIAAWRKG